MAIQTLPSSAKDVMLGHRGPVVVSCFFGWPTAAGLQAASEAQRQVIAQYGRVVTLSIVPPVDLQQARNASVTLNLPDAERDVSTRKTASVSEELAAHTTASAMIILSSGLVGVMVRSFMAAVSLMSRSTVPLKTFRNLAEGVAWLESVPGVPGPFPGLVQDVDAWLRDAVAATGTH